MIKCSSERVTDLYATGRGQDPRLTIVQEPAAWSPTGRELAFGARVGRSSDVYLINADGSDLRRLTSTG